MSVVRKKFDRELFNKYDEMAREATTEYLESKGHEVRPHPNRYAQDLMFDDKLAECEVKRVWKTAEFPYDSVQLPERKKKFFDEDTLFFIWNEDCSRAATFWSYDVKDLEPIEVPNRYNYKGEYFYQIPLDLVEFTSEIN